MAPTAPGIVFPTVTPGRVLEGALPEASGLRLDGSGVANPATAVALASLPTATPNYAACPASGVVPTVPAAAPANLNAAIGAFLNAGGSPAALEDALRGWNALGTSGFVRADYDFSGEGVPDVLLSFVAPESGGSLLLYVCANSAYSLRYQAAPGGSDAPQLMHLGDMNNDGLPEIMYAANICDEDETCVYSTQVITWSARLGRFVSLLAGALTSDAPPTLVEIDSDQVSEIVVQLENDGTAETGPLRTGTHIYDWDGGLYVLSIIQLDPPRYRIQVVHEADRAFIRLDMNAAVPLYLLALDAGQPLRYWFNDEPAILQSYALYRLLLAYAYTENEQRLAVLQDITALFPDANSAPVFVTMAQTFWNTLQVTNNLRTACQEVINVVRARPEALDLLNRYGSRSPTYSAQSLCPF